MEPKNTFSILFYLRRDRVNQKGSSPIYMRITVNGQSSPINTGRNIKSELWDTTKGNVNYRASDAGVINNHLDLMRKKVYDAHKELLDNNQIITPTAILNILTGKTEKQFTLLKLAEYHNSQMKALIGKSTTLNNFKTFKTSINYLRQFIPYQYKVDDLYLSQVNYKFLTDFLVWLQTVKPCNNNGAMKHIQRLRKLINVAIANQWMTHDPFKGYKVKYQKYERDFLSQQELATLETVLLPTSKLNRVRDLFIFSCYTGLAYVDVSNLTRDNIVLGIDGNRWIHTHREKTGIKVTIPILPKAMEIIKKYDDPGIETLLPVISNQKTNKYLKELAALCDIHKNLSFHGARHTFATTVTLSNNVPIETVSKLLGHTNLKTTQIYSRVLESKISHDMQVLRGKLEEVGDTKKTG